MTDIPITCYDSMNKRYKCDKCNLCVSYTMGNRGYKRFKSHYETCNEIKPQNSFK